MEDKLKREAKDFTHKLFKKHERNGAAAIHKMDMKKILVAVMGPDFNAVSDDLELTELLQQHVKVTKYTQHNKQTNQFEVKYQDDTLDFPSVLAIVVHFLVKIEAKSSNAFAGQQVVKFTDFPSSSNKLMQNHGSDNKKRMF